MDANSRGHKRNSTTSTGLERPGRPGPFQNKRYYQDDSGPLLGTYEDHLDQVTTIRTVMTT